VESEATIGYRKCARLAGFERNATDFGSAAPFAGFGDAAQGETKDVLMRSGAIRLRPQ
jgi:hypothetical protein